MWFLDVMNVIQTGAHISATTCDIHSKFCPFFRIDPITQIKFKFVAGSAKKYAKYRKIC
jgi:hypothetical protein